MSNYCEVHGTTCEHGFVCAWVDDDREENVRLNEELASLRAERDAARAEAYDLAGQLLTTCEQRDALAAEVARLREAIQDHLGCFAACERCGHETENKDDDIGLALRSPTTQEKPNG